MQDDAYRISDPYELDHVLDLCDDIIHAGRDLIGRLDDDDQAAKDRLVQLKRHADHLADQLKADAHLDFTVEVSYLDVEDPGDRHSIVYMQKEPLARAAAQAYNETCNWIVCADSPGWDACWYCETQLRAAWYTLLAHRIWYYGSTLQDHEPAVGATMKTLTAERAEAAEQRRELVNAIAEERWKAQEIRKTVSAIKVGRQRGADKNRKKAEERRRRIRQIYEAYDGAKYALIQAAYAEQYPDEAVPSNAVISRALNPK